MRTHIFIAAKATMAKVLQSPCVAPLAMVLLAFGVIYLTSDVQPSATAQGAVRKDAFDFPKKGVSDHPDAYDWLNTDSPISLADLKGRIVVLDFWTLCCINCIHTLPDLAKLEARYPGVLVVIGVHSPKFDNEKKSSSVLKAILRYDIKHPVINDADRKMWKTYGIDWWPTLVVIDPDGKYRDFASGEGRFDDIDRYIRMLLKEYDGKLKKDPIAFRLAKEKAHSLSFPGKILADPASKRLFIADSTNNRIVITDLAGKKIAIAGNGKEGLKDGKFSEAEFSDPQGMCLDGELLYVADRKNHSIRELNLKDQTVKIVAGNGDKQRPLPPRPAGSTWSPRKLPMSSPWDLLLFNKRIYIAAAGQHQIWYFDRSTDKMGVYAGTGEENIKDAPHARANFAQPSGLATDGKKLYVADAETSTIRAVPIGGAAGEVTTIVGSTIKDKALMTFGDVTGVGTQVRLQHALGVAHDGGKLYVADTYNSKIKLIDPLKRSCELFIGGRDEFHEPGGLSIAGGKIYVADTNNHRIQIVDLKTRAVSTLELQGVDPVQRGELSAGSLK